MRKLLPILAAAALMCGLVAPAFADNHLPALPLESPGTWSSDNGRRVAAFFKPDGTASVEVAVDTHFYLRTGAGTPFTTHARGVGRISKRSGAIRRIQVDFVRLGTNIPGASIAYTDYNFPNDQAEQPPVPVNTSGSRAIGYGDRSDQNANGDTPDANTYACADLYRTRVQASVRWGDNSLSRFELRSFDTPHPEIGAVDCSP